MALNTDALTTVAQLRTHMGESTTSLDTTRAEIAINAMSRTIRNYTGRQFLPAETAVTKKFRYDGSGILVLSQSSSWATELAATITSITLFSDLPTADQVVLSAGSSSVEADYRKGPRMGTRESTYLWLELPTVPLSSFPVGPSPGGYTLRAETKGVEVSIVANWGAGAVPGDVEAACLIAAANFLRNPESFASRSLGAFQFTDEGPQVTDTGRALPSDARALLYDYRRDTYLQ